MRSAPFILGLALIALSGACTLEYGETDYLFLCEDVSQCPTGWACERAGFCRAPDAECDPQACGLAGMVCIEQACSHTIADVRTAADGLTDGESSAVDFYLHQVWVTSVGPTEIAIQRHQEGPGVFVFFEGGVPADMYVGAQISLTLSQVSNFHGRTSINQSSVTDNDHQQGSVEHLVQDVSDLAEIGEGHEGELVRITGATLLQDYGSIRMLGNGNGLLIPVFGPGLATLVPTPCPGMQVDITTPVSEFEGLHQLFAMGTGAFGNADASSCGTNDIAAVRAAGADVIDDEVTKPVSLVVERVFVTHANPTGFFIQQQQVGPGLYVYNPNPVSGLQPAQGDQVDLWVRGLRRYYGMLQIEGRSDTLVFNDDGGNAGYVTSSLAQNISDGTVIDANLASELVRIDGGSLIVEISPDLWTMDYGTSVSHSVSVFFLDTVDLTPCQGMVVDIIAPVAPHGAYFNLTPASDEDFSNVDDSSCP